jgi:hypothetical protein
LQALASGPIDADVENPTDPAFLSTLVGDPAYSLLLVSDADDEG